MCYFFFQAEDGIRDFHVTGFRRVLFRSSRKLERGYGVLIKGKALMRNFLRTGLVRLKRCATAYKSIAMPIAWSRLKPMNRSEERRVGKECRARRKPDQ